MATKKTQESTIRSFEDSMQELETLVEAMETGELSLEDSLEHFERGVKQIRTCQKALDEAEQKVKILLQESGEEQLSDFENNGD